MLRIQLNRKCTTFQLEKTHINQNREFIRDVVKIQLPSDGSLGAMLVKQPASVTCVGFQMSPKKLELDRKWTVATFAVLYDTIRKSNRPIYFIQFSFQLMDLGFASPFVVHTACRSEKWLRLCLLLKRKKMMTDALIGKGVEI
jgi:hypothetical protein